MKYKLLLIPLCMIFLISIVSADFSFDNYKEFEKGNLEYGKATIYDTNLFSADNKLAEITLIDNSDYCYSNCYAEGTLTLHESGKLIDSLRFDLGSIRNYRVYVQSGTKSKSVPDIKEVCEVQWIEANKTNSAVCKNEVSGYKTIQVPNWIEYGNQKLNVGTYNWRIEGTKSNDVIVDWIGSWFGIEVNEWAVWRPLRIQPTVYYKFDEVSGSIENATDYSGNKLNLTNYGAEYDTGKLAGAVYPTATEFLNRSDTEFNFGTGDFSFTFWFNATNLGDGVFGTGTAQSGQQGFQLRLPDFTQLTFQFKDGSNDAICSNTSWAWNDTDWHFVVISRNATNITLWLDGDYGGACDDENINIGTGGDFYLGRTPDGSKTFAGGVDSLAYYNISLTSENVSALWNNGDGVDLEGSEGAPVVTLNDPPNNNQSIKRSVLFNCSAESLTDDIQNITLFIDGISNYTETGGTDTFLELYQTIDGLGRGNRTWNCTSYTNDSEHGTATNRNLEILYFFEESQTFNATTQTGSTETFEINITYDTEYTNTQGTLYYNGVPYVATKIEDGDNLIFRRAITISNITANTNVSFIWQMGFFDTQWNYFNSSGTQDVQTISLDDCGTNSNLILNFTLKDEETQVVINATQNNASVEVHLQIFSLDSSNEIANYSQNYSKIDNPQVCIDNLNTSYRMDVEIFYKADEYAQEFYNIQKAILSNATVPNNINLFDLKDSDATQFLITYKDENFVPVSDVLIEIQRKYISEGVFKAVEIPKTDNEGQATASLDLEGVKYTFLVTQNNAVVATFNNIAVYCEDRVIEDCRINLNQLSKGFAVSDDRTPLLIWIKNWLMEEWEKIKLRTFL